jgi:hypothetical protein
LLQQQHSNSIPTACQSADMLLQRLSAWGNLQLLFQLEIHAQHMHTQRSGTHAMMDVVSVFRQTSAFPFDRPQSQTDSM